MKIIRNLTKINKFLIFLVLIGIIGIIQVVTGFFIIIEPLKPYTRYASNTLTMPIGDYNFTADIICNLTSKAGFFCLEPIHVSAIVVHELPPEFNLTRLVFLESKDYPPTFFEIENESSVWVPDGGTIYLTYSHSFFREGIENHVYTGEGTISYDYEGSFSTTLKFKEETQIRYTTQLHEFTAPTLVVRTQAEYQQIKNAKVNLGLAWIVVGLTIWTIILAILGLIKIRHEINHSSASMYV